MIAPMGQQTHFYMLPDDCHLFANFVQKRDPVVFVETDAQSAAVSPIQRPCSGSHDLCLWNQRLLPDLKRDFIPASNRGPYYRIDLAWPVIELLLPRPSPWDGIPALTQGRIYTWWGRSADDAGKWYASLASWLRRHFSRNPNRRLGGYVGPAALEWHKQGNLLLPTFRPPVNDVWRAYLQQPSPRPKRRSSTKS
jgi:hypothetical protein